MKLLLPLRVALPLAALCAAAAGYLFFLASRRKGKKKAAPLAVGIILSVVALLLPVLAFDVVKRVRHKIARIRGGGSSSSSAGKVRTGNALTIPQATLFS